MKILQNLGYFEFLLPTNFFGDSTSACDAIKKGGCVHCVSRQTNCVSISPTAYVGNFFKHSPKKIPPHSWASKFFSLKKIPPHSWANEVFTTHFSSKFHVSLLGAKQEFVIFPKSFAHKNFGCSWTLFREFQCYV